ncbi:Putative collagen-binding domain of a collagenase [Salegentibacter agarivorans]|uniref:Putative collagen-binding domain of a collagenase n=1 Tax=Salegentibacter agarivorans TaxID=345907 RepID=A0A1I2KLZ3_9FLAO|nr:DUF5060 domain-containing protein [Salegentibacter agarivorans]SFF67985.1 Putative collagen-binding domain of a collagenase [Salegentibacter agarivorans]
MNILQKASFLIVCIWMLLPGRIDAQNISGELKKWHKITLDFKGPETSEDDVINPFLNYRLNVTFTHKETGKSYLIPGYFAADGNAANSGANSGNIWRVHFAPDETGEWNYKVDFKKGKWAAIRSYKKFDSAGFMDEKTGGFDVGESDKSGRDFRGKGRLQYIDERYLQFAGNGEYFLKCGADAPENFLAYDEFDGTFHNDGHKDDLVKTWEAHEKDWQTGDPVWQNNKGKDIVGAMNYLASKGMNAVSFLTMNIEGDDQNVFPYVDYDTYDRFDCSKLDQWEILFEHADKIGLFLHFKTMEVENQGLLDNGGVGLFTKLYYRELIARFGHHLALNWNLCEENGDWVKETKTFPLESADYIALADYVASTDTYNHHIVIHNGEWFDEYYGDKPKITGASLQTNKPDFRNVHKQVKNVLKASEENGKIWAVACDEPGDAQHSLLPDAEDPNHDDARKNGLWGAMMAGAWGTEWYFGYAHPHSDLTAQDYRSRDFFWDQGKICLDFFNKNNIHFWDMEPLDHLISSEEDYVLANPGTSYVVYLKNGGNSSLNFEENEGNYKVLWYNPRKGGKLEQGSVKRIQGQGKQSLGIPPNDIGKDWVALITKNQD